MPRPIQIILVPYHAGTASLAVGAGPYAICSAGLVARLESSGHTDSDIEFTEIPNISAADLATKHIGEIGRSFEIIRRVAMAVAEAREQGRFPLVLAGNCNASVGVVAGMGYGRDAAGVGAGGEGKGEVLWFDAHPDLDTPEMQTTGYFDVNAVALLAGKCWAAFRSSIPNHKPISLATDFTYIGLRDFSNDVQRQAVADAGCPVVWGGAETPAAGFAAGLEESLQSSASGRKAEDRPAVLHLDVDCLDTSVGIANFAASPGGLTADELVEAVKVAKRGVRVEAMTVASFDPGFEGAEGIAEAAIRAILAVME